MIKELSFRPEPRNNYAKIIFLVTILVSATAFVTAFVIDRYRGILGMFAIMTLFTAILFYTKYISPVFCYDIIFDSENIPVFTVIKIVGRRQTALCRIDLADIVSIEHETKEERRNHKTPKGVRRYIYAPTVFPKEVYRLTVKNRYENAEIIIEGTKEFAEILKEYSSEARTLRVEEE
jgi:hypothetical protein